MIECVSPEIRRAEARVERAYLHLAHANMAASLNKCAKYEMGRLDGDVARMDRPLVESESAEIERITRDVEEGESLTSHALAMAQNECRAAMRDYVRVYAEEVDRTT